MPRLFDYAAMDSAPVILLTSSAFAFDLTVQLKSHELRVFHTLESVQQWLRICPTAKLVICDGSGFDFSELIRTRFPGADIECLAFLNDQERVRVQGKGFGEGEIIKYALAHSESMQSSPSFTKCTGKLWVENYHDCMREWTKGLLCFGYFKDVFSLRPTVLDYIDTRFYVVDRDFYRRFLSEAHQKVGGQWVEGIEQRFLEVVLEHKLTGVLMTTVADVRGVGGAAGTYFKTGLRRELKSKLRLALVRRDRSFAHLFNAQHEG